jgi:AcrR family transcriptional regulator
MTQGKGAVVSKPKLPQGAKGQRTRARVVAAARAVFERKGYLDARVVDIAVDAGIGHGTFYSYFDSKEDVFSECAHAVAEDLFTAYDVPPGLSPTERIHHRNHRYVQLYEKNAAMMGLMEQVALFNEDLLELRTSIRRHFVERVESAIAHLNETRPADEVKLDPLLAANALGSLVDNFCYTWFVLGEPFQRDAALETIDRIWTRALGLEDDG